MRTRTKIAGTAAVILGVSIIAGWWLPAVAVLLAYIGWMFARIPGDQRRRNAWITDHKEDQ